MVKDLQQVLNTAFKDQHMLEVIHLCKLASSQLSDLVSSISSFLLSSNVVEIALLKFMKAWHKGSLHVVEMSACLRCTCTYNR